jgi:hypothetical protein
MDIKDFNLCTPMDRNEYMRIPINLIPVDIFEQYNLAEHVHNGFVFVEISKTMYGLPQAGKLANDALIPILAKAGYHQAKHTHGLFIHESKPIKFALTVDDFGVSYVGKDNALHLQNTIAEHYKCTTDWEGKLYCGLTIDWDYENGTVDISIPGYIEKALQRFQHPKPKKPQHSPHPCILPDYGARQQLTEIDTTDAIDAAQRLRLQEGIGVILWYARGVGITYQVALSTLASALSKGTQKTMSALAQLLDYAATHPNDKIRFHKSDMILHIHSDASYLSEPEAKSRVGGFFFLSSKDDPNKKPLMNGATHIVCNLLKIVTASAAEAETAGLFYNGQEAEPIRVALEEMGWPQPPTPITTDNQTACGIANDTVKQRRSKAIDMRFYWIRDRIKQGHFRVHWRPGDENWADYFTKHHPAKHHIEMRPIFYHEPTTETQPGLAAACEGVLNECQTPARPANAPSSPVKPASTQAYLVSDSCMIFIPEYEYCTPGEPPFSNTLISHYQTLLDRWQTQQQS